MATHAHTTPFNRSAIARAAHAEVRAVLDGLRRAAAAGWSSALDKLASFSYVAEFGRGMRHAWADARQTRDLASDPIAAAVATRFAVEVSTDGRLSVAA